MSLLATIAGLCAAATAGRRDPVAFYDRLAPHYDQLHGMWLRLGGQEAVAAVEGSIASHIRPGDAVLDAGCGTGKVARRLLKAEPDARVTLFDGAANMLVRTRDILATRQVGDLRNLPFADGSFDIVLCTWALETLSDDRALALSELHRVLKQGGLLCYCVCSRPISVITRIRTWSLRQFVRRVCCGRFLKTEQLGQEAARGCRVLTFHRGLSTVVIYRKGLPA